MCVCTFNIRNLKITFQKIFSVSMLSIFSLRQQLKFSVTNFKLKFPVPTKYFTFTKFIPCPNLKKVRQFSRTFFFFFVQLSLMCVGKLISLVVLKLNKKKIISLSLKVSIRKRLYDRAGDQVSVLST